MNSWFHAKSAAKKWGGEPEDYLPIHEFIDSSKQVIGDVRHRSVYHHTLGVFLCEKIFGKTITVKSKSGRKKVQVPVRLIAERHILEDLGWLPSPKDYIDGMAIKPWMSGAQRKELPLSHLLGEQDEEITETKPAEPEPAPQPPFVPVPYIVPPVQTLPDRQVWPHVID